MRKQLAWNYVLKKKFLVGLFYRPPNSSANSFESFDVNIEYALDSNLDQIILGDCNPDMLKTSINSPLHRILTKYSLNIVINILTRITRSSETYLDLILTKHNSIINNSEILPPFNSDDCTIIDKSLKHIKHYHIKIDLKIRGS